MTAIRRVLLLFLLSALHAACAAEPVEQCFVAGDEDDNGLADCADAACWRPNGACPQECTSVHDQDADGLVGCADPDCWVAGGDCAEDCASVHDEDGDGQASCADEDCWMLGGVCPEVCAQAGDEDGDGLADCSDSDCWGPNCSELCSGGADEDGDGQADCDDPDCLTAVGCAPGYEQDIKPIFKQHCSGETCHFGDVVSGGLDMALYDDLAKPAIYGDCAGHTKGWCTLLRIQQPSMPPSCLGCLSPEEVDAIQRWVDAGIPE